MSARAVVLLALTAFAAALAAQDAPRMTQARLHAILGENATRVQVAGNVAVIHLNDVQLLCISDEIADRMRIIAAVKRLEEATPQELLAALHANFHTLLDARYAVSEGVIFAAFLHPLSSLTRAQVVSALQQVAAARATFGSSYSGGGPAFGGAR